MRTPHRPLLALAAAAAVAVPCLAAMPASAHSDDGTELSATLGELNHSGGSGTAWGWIDGNELQIKVEVTGLLDGAPHAQHIHIGGTHTCPDPSMKGTGVDGAIRVTDAIGSYGDVAVSLTKAPGMTGAEHGLDVADFPMTGTYTYERTITLDDATAKSVAAGDGVIVVHGVDHNGSGKYDGKQKSDLDPSLPSEATDPALCGAFDVAQMAMPGGGVETGGGDTSGIEQQGALVLSAALLGAGALGLGLSRRRGQLGHRSAGGR